VVPGLLHCRAGLEVLAALEAALAKGGDSLLAGHPDQSASSVASSTAKVRDDRGSQAVEHRGLLKKDGSLLSQ
jgi:hypothetical protein